jgi:hypothetical protein
MTAHRITTTAGTLLATVALATPALAQSGHQDLRSPDARDAAAAAAATPRQDLRSPDARDAARPARPVVVEVARADAGFAWDSAAIGALAGAGLLLSVAGGSVLVTRRRPRTARPA